MNLPDSAKNDNQRIAVVNAHRSDSISPCGVQMSSVVPGHIAFWEELQCSNLT